MKRTSLIFYGVLCSIPSGIIALWLFACINSGGLSLVLTTIQEFFRGLMRGLSDWPLMFKGLLMVIKQYYAEFPVMLRQAVQLESLTEIVLGLGYLAAAYVVPVATGIRQGCRADDNEVGLFALISVPARTVLVTVATFFTVMFSSLLLALVVALVEYFTVGVILGWVGLGWLAVVLVISSLTAPSIIIEIYLD